MTSCSFWVFCLGENASNRLFQVLSVFCCNLLFQVAQGHSPTSVLGANSVVCSCVKSRDKKLYLVALNTRWDLLTGSLSEGQAEPFNRGPRGSTLPSLPGDRNPGCWFPGEKGLAIHVWPVGFTHLLLTWHLPALSPAVGLLLVLHSKSPSLGDGSMRGGK